MQIYCSKRYFVYLSTNPIAIRQSNSNLGDCSNKTGFFLPKTLSQIFSSDKILNLRDRYIIQHVTWKFVYIQTSATLLRIVVTGKNKYCINNFKNM